MPIAVAVAATTANAIPSQERTPMKRLPTDPIVGFEACPKAIRSIVLRRGSRFSSGRRSRSRRRIRVLR